jgi:predicted  nucleic acid-binding Zn-ribbon protein
MNEATHADILRRVEKVEIDVAVLDSKSNRLHQDMKDVDKKVDSIMETLNDVKTSQQITNTRIIAIPAILAAVWTLIQIAKSVHIV